jgi:hypothetical protein
MILIAKVALLMALVSSASLISRPSKYFSMIVSSESAAASINFSRYSAAVDAISSGIASSRNLAPRLSSSQTIAFIRTKSMTPMNLSSAPIGNCNGTARAPRRSLII